LAVSTTAIFDENTLQTTTAISSSASSRTTLYSTTARSSVPVRLLGWFVSTQTTAGTWSSSPSTVSIRPIARPDTPLVAIYQANSNTSVANTGTSVDFLSKQTDTHNAVNNVSGSWKFTAPIAGYYKVSTAVTFGSPENWSGSSHPGIQLYKNGSAVVQLAQYTVISALTNVRLCTLTGSYTISLAAGDYIDVRASHGESTSRTVTYNAINNGETWISIQRE
jgi:hypothetical protein